MLLKQEKIAVYLQNITIPKQGYCLFICHIFILAISYMKYVAGSLLFEERDNSGQY